MGKLAIELDPTGLLGSNKLQSKWDLSTQNLYDSREVSLNSSIVFLDLSWVLVGPSLMCEYLYFLVPSCTDIRVHTYGVF